MRRSCCRRLACCEFSGGRLALGRPPLRLFAPRPTCRAARRRLPRGPAGAAAHWRHRREGSAGRLGDGLPSAVPAAGRGVAPPYPRHRGRRSCGRCDHRHRGGLVRGADAAAGAAGLGRAGGRPPRRPGLHHQLCLGLPQPLPAGFRGRPAGGHQRLLPAGLSAGGRGAARHGSGRRGDGARPRLQPGRLLLSHRAAPASAGIAGRHAARHPRRARRVRRLLAAAVPNLHHPDLCRVQQGIQRARRIPSHRRAVPPVPALPRRRAEGARRGTHMRGLGRGTRRVAALHDLGAARISCLPASCCSRPSPSACRWA